MRQIELAPGVKSSALGFGCAPVLGAVEGSAARRAVDCALDHGVTHFDLARSYGYGQAEAFLGQLMAGKRDQVTLASKFGIRANWKASLLRPLKPLVRRLRGARRPAAPASPAPVAPAPAGIADRFHDRVPLTPASMTNNLEKSLAALRTDYLDILFIHEPPASHARFDDLLAAAEELKSAGKIRAFGLAFAWSALGDRAAEFGGFDALQFDNSPGAPHYADALRARGDRPNVFFSPLRGAAGLSPEEALRRMWGDFPRSVILCSMFQEKHIRQNAAWAAET